MTVREDPPGVGTRLVIWVTIVLLVAVVVTMAGALNALPEVREPEVPLPAQYSTWSRLFTLSDSFLLLAALGCFAERQWLLAAVAVAAVPLTWCFLMLTTVGPT